MISDESCDRLMCRTLASFVTFSGRIQTKMCRLDFTGNPIFYLSKLSTVKSETSDSSFRYQLIPHFLIFRGGARMTAESASHLELTLSPSSSTDTTLTSYAELTRSQPCQFNLHSGSIVHAGFKPFLTQVVEDGYEFFAKRQLVRLE